MGDVFVNTGKAYSSTLDITPRTNYQFTDLLADFKNVGQGFLDENLIAIGIKSAVDYMFNTNRQQFEVDDEYDIFADPQFIGYENLIGNFIQAKNQTHATKLFNDFKENLKKGYGSPAYIMGRVLGGFTDPTSLFMFTKAGQFLMTGSRLARAGKVGGVVAAEEQVKRLFDDKRTTGESALITAGGFIIPSLFPTIKGKNAAKNFDKSASMLDDADDVAMSGSAGAAQNKRAKMMTDEDYAEFNKIKSTGLGVFGEKGPWNPVFRVLNNGISASQEYIEKVLEIPLLQNKNFKRGITEQSIERKVKSKYYIIYQAEQAIDNLYNDYLKSMGVKNQNWGEKLIGVKLNRGKNVLSPSEFRKEIFLAKMNLPNKNIPQAKQAAIEVDKFVYKKLGQEYIDVGVPLNWHRAYLEKANKITASLREKFATRGLTVKGQEALAKWEKITARLESRIKMFESGEGLRKNYVNIVWKRDMIEANWEEFSDLLRETIKKRYPEMKGEELAKIVASFRKYQPVIAYDKIDDLLLKGELNPEKIEKISSRFFARDLDINLEDFVNAGYIETDIQTLQKLYFNQVVPDIEITKVFGDPLGLGTQWKPDGKYTVGIQQIADEYDELIAAAPTIKQKNNLAKRKDEILADLDASIHLIRGTYGLADDPNRFISRGIRINKLYHSFSMLTGIAQVVDTARLVMINGISKTFRTSWELFTSKMGKEIFNMSKKSAQLGGEAMDLWNSSRAMSMYDVGDAFGVYNKFERGLSSVGNLYFTFLNLSNPWNTAVKSMASFFNGTRIFESVEKLAAGSISKVDRARLLSLGIDDAMAKRILKQYQQHGVGKGGKTKWTELGDDYKYLRVANSDEWTDELAKEAYNNAIGKQVNIDIVTPSKGDVPLWANTEVGGMIAQFKKFGMASTQRMLMRGLQEKDMNQLQGILLLLAAGAAVDAFRQRAFDRDYSKKPFGQKIVDAFDRSGIGGIYSDVNNAIERLGNNQIGLRPLLGAKKPYGTYRDFFNNPVPDILGPTASQIANIADIAWTWGTGKYNHHTARNVRRLLPFQNVWFLDSIFDKMEKDVLR